jgi:hypothetical protein
VANYTAIEANGRFKVLNLNSKCAYGDFGSRDEAEQAIADAAHADVASRAEAA